MTHSSVLFSLVIIHNLVIIFFVISYCTIIRESDQGQENLCKLLSGPELKYKFHVILNWGFKYENLDPAQKNFRNNVVILTIFCDSNGKNLKY